MSEKFLFSMLCLLSIGALVFSPTKLDSSLEKLNRIFYYRDYVFKKNTKVSAQGYCFFGKDNKAPDFLNFILNRDDLDKDISSTIGYFMSVKHDFVKNCLKNRKSVHRRNYQFGTNFCLHKLDSIVWQQFCFKQIIERIDQSSEVCSWNGNSLVDIKKNMLRKICNLLLVTAEINKSSELAFWFIDQESNLVLATAEYLFIEAGKIAEVLGVELQCVLSIYENASKMFDVYNRAPLAYISFDHLDQSFKASMGLDCIQSGQNIDFLEEKKEVIKDFLDYKILELKRTIDGFGMETQFELEL